ncbi:hypothetical protein [Streptomyces europaeiscabiei]|uniref:hypothetical protein n=1 Tax=Streptomyces europaeiscabiei TaxID=146819 RepID=UPI002E296D0D|nr:hypothetical protein [Streptomyces europaeiscabiei]
MASPRPVVVLTALDDVTADHVITELHSRGVPVVRLDPGSPGEVTFSGRAGSGWSWHGPSTGTASSATAQVPRTTG